MVSYNDFLNKLLISFTQIIKVKLENDGKKVGQLWKISKRCTSIRAKINQEAYEPY